MKKMWKNNLIINEVSIVINLFVIIYSVINYKEIELMVNILIPIVGMLIIMYLSKEKYQHKISRFFTVWITGYNLLYIVLSICLNINLYEKSYRIAIQLIVPFLYGLIVKRIENMTTNDEKKCNEGEYK